MSFNVVNKTTGATTQIAGNADDRGIGNLNSLTTTNKSSLVSAINEVNAESNNVFKGTMSDWNQLDTEEKIEYDYAIISNDFNPAAIGNLSALHTTDQSSIVGAINEVADTKQNISDNSLNTTSKTIPGAINELKSGLNGLLKYKVFDIAATDTTNHLYNTDVSVSQYICVGGCTPYNPNFVIQLSNIEITTTGIVRYRLYDVANNQVVSDNAQYVVELVFVDKSMLS